jgi:L-threonylcarbamoyladenylate synthase
VPVEVTGGSDTIGIRMPNHPVALQLLRAHKGPLAAPSANRFGGVSPTTAAHVVRELGERVKIVLNGGPCQVGIESTIVDLTGGAPTVLRLGAVTVQALSEALGKDVRAIEETQMKVPGQGRSHYKPDAAVYIVQRPQIDNKIRDLRADGCEVGLVLRERISGLEGVHHTQVVGEATHAYARKLYECLRFADEKGVDAVIVEPPEQDGLGMAILDRLTRASAQS